MAPIDDNTQVIPTSDVVRTNAEESKEEILTRYIGRFPLSDYVINIKQRCKN